MFYAVHCVLEEDLEKGRNKSIDFFKFVFSIFVIGIHTNLFSDLNSVAHFSIVNVFFRLSVPYFVMCTGYFVSKSIAYHKKSLNPLWKQEKKLVFIYLFWSLFFLIIGIPQWLNTGWFSLNAINDFFVASIFKYSHYHLWYLISLIYALPLAGCIFYIKKNGMKIVIMLFLYFIHLFVGGYGELLPLCNDYNYLLEYIEIIWAFYRAFFFMIPFLICGHLSSLKLSFSKIKCLLGFIISLILLYTEAFFSQNVFDIGMSFYLMTFPTAYLLFNLLFQIQVPISTKACSYLGSLSIIIYCIHPAFIELFQSIKINSIILFLLIVFLSVLSAAIIQFMKHLFMKFITGKQK